jgi:hypothetical protein
VLDGVERRRFFIQPAREHPAPAFVRLLNVDLDESAGQFLGFPWRGRLARAQPHDHVLPAHRLTRVKRDRLDDAVALVEDAEHGHALRHRGHAALARRGRGDLSAARRRRILLALAARCERKHDQQRSSNPAHDYSGIQGS